MEESVGKVFLIDISRRQRGRDDPDGNFEDGDGNDGSNEHCLFPPGLEHKVCSRNNRKKETDGRSDPATLFSNLDA